MTKQAKTSTKKSQNKKAVTNNSEKIVEEQHEKQNEEQQQQNQQEQVSETSVEELKKEIENLKEKILVEKASNINYINRTSKECESKVRRAEDRILKNFLGIMDYYRAGMLYADKVESSETKNLVYGFKMVENQLEDFFKSKNIEKFSADGQSFDSSLHNPINVVTSSDVKTATVTKEYIPGYKRDGYVLRLANVEVAFPKKEKEINNKDQEKDEEVNTDD